MFVKQKPTQIRNVINNQKYHKKYFVITFETLDFIPNSVNVKFKQKRKIVIICADFSLLEIFQSQTFTADRAEHILCGS